MGVLPLWQCFNYNIITWALVYNILLLLLLVIILISHYSLHYNIILFSAVAARQNAFDDGGDDERVGGYLFYTTRDRPWTWHHCARRRRRRRAVYVPIIILKTRYRQPSAPLQPPCMRATGTTTTRLEWTDVRLFLNFGLNGFARLWADNLTAANCYYARA